MRLEYTKHCDVLVAGSGVAGIMAALAAARAGRSVILASSGPVFSGSSFYPGTWGLGLIGPENEADQEDLVQSILEVGCGMADETMVRAFVAGIGPAIESVKAMGVQLKAAADQNQKDFIPCFDRKHRSWNGLLFDSMRQVFSRKMEESGVEQLPGCELLQLIKTGERVSGAVICQKGELTAVQCGALVLATGGYGGLFRDRLTTDDVAGTGQWLALEAGAELVNLEFMQMMPGYLSPCRKTIFNEKTFRYTRLTGPDGRDILENEPDRQALLECRSTHGPFTSRLVSKRVDLAMVKAAQAAPEQGVTVTYGPEIRQNTPEFVRTYFDWLWEKKHLTMDDPVQIAPFAHAANGGVRIDAGGFTGVPGLFACGEVTGGMHGADRIGGLSTANGLVFGRKAGESAAAFAAAQPVPEAAGPVEFEARIIPDQAERRRRMQDVMSECGMVVRSGEALARGIECLDQLTEGCEFTGGSDAAQIAASRRLWAQLHLARAILSAQQMRTESRGSHYRADYPDRDPALEKRILVRMQNGAAQAAFEQNLAEKRSEVQ
ncbi:FAD-binding protein [Allofournierella massiliensis]|uniref:L-aspartate oxidase n=1 Tax=Allofournierella massiliensis TaxID=1650663 RepID=A0ABT7UTY3_9FIRM|nr:FAD-binding protein [Fournierella massiliensis]MDM8202359.1 FAD-binding protein [Fournierella massiliensis]